MKIQKFPSASSLSSLNSNINEKLCQSISEHDLEKEKSISQKFPSASSLNSDMSEKEHNICQSISEHDIDMDVEEETCSVNPYQLTQSKIETDSKPVPQVTSLGPSGDNPRQFIKPLAKKVNQITDLESFRDNQKENLEENLIQRACKLGSASETDTKVKDFLQNLVNNGEPAQHTSLSCRSIRIGSYRATGPVAELGSNKMLNNAQIVHFTPDAIYFKVPSLTDINCFIKLVIFASDILGIGIISQPSMLLIISTTPNACKRIREDLNLIYKSQGLYFDITSNDDTMKNITLLPEKFPEEIKNKLMQFYDKTITELDDQSANKLLAKSTPKNFTLQAQQLLQVKQYKINILEFKILNIESVCMINFDFRINLD